MGKYAPYFKDNETLPIPELTEAVEPKTLSFVVTDLKTRRLDGIKDVLLPSEDLAKKLAVGNISTKHYKLQPEYRPEAH